MFLGLKNRSHKGCHIFLLPEKRYYVEKFAYCKGFNRLSSGWKKKKRKFIAVNWRAHRRYLISKIEGKTDKQLKIQPQLTVILS
jgi:hypothetical protein